MEILTVMTYDVKHAICNILVNDQNSQEKIHALNEHDFLSNNDDLMNSSNDFSLSIVKIQMHESTRLSENFLIYKMQLFGRISLTLVLTLIVIITLIFVIIPLILYRQVIYCIAKVFKPHLKTPLEPLSAILAAEDIFSEDAFNLQLSMELDESNAVAVKDLQRKVLDNLIYAKNSKGNLLNPHLTCTISHFLGYAFWSETKTNFDVTRHVYQVDDLRQLGFPEGVLKASLPEILSTTARKKWRRGSPLWEIVVIPPKLLSEANYNFQFIIRIHHTIGDGFSILKLVLRVFETKLNFSSSYNNDWKSKLYLILRGPWDYVNFLCDNNLSGGQRWSFKEKSIKSSKMIGGYTRKFNVEVLKRIRERQGVDVTSIMLSCVSTAMRKMIENQDHSVGKNLEVDVAFTMIMPSSNEGMENNVSFMSIPLPVGEEDEFKRLQKISKIIKRIKNNSGILFAVFYGYKCLGLFPSWVLKMLRLKGDTGPPCIAVNSVGTSTTVGFQGSDFVDSYIYLNSCADCKGLMFELMMYRGHVYLGIQANGKYLQNHQQLECLLQNISQHIERLADSE